MMLCSIDRSIDITLQTQLFRHLQGLILAGRLSPRTRMPATRELAKQLQVSRTTVMLVYDALIAEGYLETKPAAGTFISAKPPGDVRAPSSLSDLRSPVRRPNGGVRNSREGAPAQFDFRPHGFDGTLFPAKAWQRLASQALRECARAAIDEGPSGLACLRAAIAEWMTAERGTATSPDEVIIVSGGRRQAHQILAHLALGDGKLALVDASFPRSLASIFESAGATVVPLPSMNAGAPLRGLAGAETAALVWIRMPHETAPEISLNWWKWREALSDWADNTGTLIAEYDGAVHNPVLAPRSSSRSPSNVIRLGRFSPTLGPGAHLGYMVVPGHLVERAKALKTWHDREHPWLEQIALARFIEEGGYSRHLRRVRKVYLERRSAMIGALWRHFGNVLIDDGVDDDYLKWVLPVDLPSSEVICDRARAQSIEIVGGNESARADTPALCLGYSRMSAPQIVAGIEKLARVILGIGCTPVFSEVSP